MAPSSLKTATTADRVGGGDESAEEQPGAIGNSQQRMQPSPTSAEETSNATTATATTATRSRRRSAKLR